MVLLALASPAMTAAINRFRDADPALEEAVRRDEDALADLVAEKDDGLIGRGEYLSRRSRIEKRLDANPRQTRTGYIGRAVGLVRRRVQRPSESVGES
jgi:hypothetical protein